MAGNINKKSIIVIGGGPAGMMAAVYAAMNGADVILIERNEKLGKKLYITGKGRCNVCNNCDLDEFLSNIPRNPKFLYSAYATLSSQDLMALLESAGCKLKTERGKRVFPESDKASDVSKALIYLLNKYGVEIVYNTRVKELLLIDNTVKGVLLEGGEKLYGDAVIIATGGKSYPVTGSTGYGYILAKQAGHTIVQLMPSLIPIVVNNEFKDGAKSGDAKQDWPMQLQGLSLKNVKISAWHKKKLVYSEMGEMLFTHFGYSGPLILEMSSHVIDYDLGNIKIALDLKPALSKEKLEARLLRDFSENLNKQFKSILLGLFPGKLAEVFGALCGIDLQKPVHQIMKKERERMIDLMKALPLPIGGYRPIEEAIVTRGGVNVKEILPMTMESRLAKGLYFAGEVLDVDGHTGGFNLQIAFSTGALAGKSAAEI